MKSYTNLEQSKKLAKILPIESADMHYYKNLLGDYTVGLYNSSDLKEGFELVNIEYIPCWSLAALLEVLPEPTLTNTNSIWRCTLSYKWGNAYFEKGKIQKTISSKESIDACYEMIMQLGPNLLSKLKL